MGQIRMLADSFQSGEQRIDSVVDRCLNAIERSSLNTFVQVDRTGAELAARQCQHYSEHQASLGPLHGVPIGIKDIIDVAGTTCTRGSEQYLDNWSSCDAAVVSRLRNAGAVILGKTHTAEFAYMPTGDVSAFGAALNPVDPSRVTGGSSSGSAAAVRANLCVAAIGTDTGGSIRLPAALCGVVGMKPTYELVPRSGVFPLSDSLDHVGPLTRTVIDNALVLSAISDKRTDYASRICRSIRGMRLGVPGDFYTDYLSSGASHALEQAKEVLSDAGATVVPIEVRAIGQIYEAHQLILQAEAYALHRSALRAGAPFSEDIRNRLMAANNIAAADYLSALQFRREAIGSFDQALEDVDALITATCGIVAPRQFERQTHLNGRDHPTFKLLTRLTAPTNLSGHPSLSVPFGAEHNLPLGIQLIGRKFGEATIYQIAAVLEHHNIARSTDQNNS